ncbi:hypothetical protein Salat_1156100 [Sesamum alatum]|uniref:Uncharacterized protein n=1 Tax=Sesamum alatum TaxID=300844 RepID=A0AAE1YFF3_9LAMI|nr:hypothetical protein Salat_1156100 [Sesamum alatum]
MRSLNCFHSPWRRRKDKGEKKYIKPADNEKTVKSLHVDLEHLQKTSDNELRSTSFSVPVSFPGSSRFKVEVMNHESQIAAESGEVDYEAGDEHDEMKRDNSEFSFRTRLQNSNEEKYQMVEGTNSPCSLDIDYDVYMHDKMRSSNTEEGLEMITSGHVSDPGMETAEFWASPKLKCKSYEEMPRSTEISGDEVLVGDGTTSVSGRSLSSANKVILKKHSPSQILPSRSRRLWQILFLWSRKNLNRARTAKSQPLEIKPSAFDQQAGYSSDAIEPRQAMDTIGTGKGDTDDHSWDGFYGASGMWPQNQWVAFPTDSSHFTRVNEWVKEVSSQPPFQVDIDDQTEDGILFPPSPENNSTSPARGSSHLSRHSAINKPEEISQANSIIQSLNTHLTVAHMTGIGLKATPSISQFSSLRSVNLSNNFIVHIAPGSLPKGLHILNLSRNKIHTIEGLRELTHLRVLDLSYNRVTRIGQGLSRCTLVKELYLSGNKISNVEGLHRLLKLTVLDLSFNKISTEKALGQLVANYHTLIALNLLGNPIQGNISNDQLRKTLCGLLPKLALLNKQPITPQKAREIRADANAKAALGTNGWSSRRKSFKSMVSQGSSSSHSMRRSSSVGTAQKTKQRSKSRAHHGPALKDKA